MTHSSYFDGCMLGSHPLEWVVGRRVANARLGHSSAYANIFPGAGTEGERAKTSGERHFPFLQPDRMWARKEGKCAANGGEKNAARKKKAAK